MQTGQRSDQFVTPEAVELSLDAAGLGSRMIAILVDSAIQLTMLVLLGLAFQGMGLKGTSAAAAGLASVFLVFLGYFTLFEGLWGGQTPGKRAQRIRVMRIDGQPAGWTPVVLRNLLRLVDLLPVAYGVGSLSILLTGRCQRVGDLAAGTVVVRERRAPIPLPLKLPIGAVSAGQHLDSTAMSEAEYAVIRSFLERRGKLVAASRQQLALELATIVRRRAGGANSWTGTDEALLEAAAASYRTRFKAAGPDPSLPPPPR